MCWLPAKLFFLASATVYALVVLTASGEGAKCPVPIYCVAVSDYEAGAHLCLAFIQPCRGGSWRAQSSALPDAGQEIRLAGSETTAFLCLLDLLYCVCLCRPSLSAIAQPFIYRIMPAVNHGDCRSWQPVVFQEPTPECCCELGQKSRPAVAHVAWRLTMKQCHGCNTEQHGVGKRPSSPGDRARLALGT